MRRIGVAIATGRGMAAALVESERHLTQVYGRYQRKDFDEEPPRPDRRNIRDANNYDRGDSRFPFLRDFDIFAGHDWAAGHGAFFAGNNQESSSEAMQSWAGLFLLGGGYITIASGLFAYLYYAVGVVIAMASIGFAHGLTIAVMVAALGATVLLLLLGAVEGRGGRR